jgi:hypothetical protein
MSDQQPEDKSENPIESFPKPRTFPANWDMSGITKSKPSADSEEDQSEDQMESFPKPRTFPANWDMSELTK